MDHTTVKIDQKRFLRGRQSLILDGNMLKVESMQWLSLNEYRFDLRGFLPDPMRIKRVPLTGMIGCVFGILLLGASLFVGLRSTDEEIAASCGGFAVLLFVVLIVGVMRTLRGFVNLVWFQGPGGQVVLWPDQPNKAEFDTFVATLTKRIRQAQDHEGNLLRQLRMADIINDWQYDQALEWLQQQGGRPHPS